MPLEFLLASLMDFYDCLDLIWGNKLVSQRQSISSTSSIICTTLATIKVNTTTSTWPNSLSVLDVVGELDHMWRDPNWAEVVSSKQPGDKARQKKQVNSILKFSTTNLNNNARNNNFSNGTENLIKLNQQREKERRTTDITNAQTLKHHTLRTVPIFTSLLYFICNEIWKTLTSGRVQSATRMRDHPWFQI